MSNSNPINLFSLDGRYITPSGVDTKITSQASLDAAKYAQVTGTVYTGAVQIQNSSSTRAFAVKDSTNTNTYFAIDPSSTQKRIVIGNGAYVSGFNDEVATETLRLDPSKGAVRPGSPAGVGSSIYSGSGAPALSANIGDVYKRTDSGLINQWYECIVANTAAAASWRRISGPSYDFPYTIDPGMIRSNDALAVPGANSAVYLRVKGAGTVTGVALYVVASSGNISVAVYRNSGTGRSSVPGVQVATSGSVACPAVGDRTISLGSSTDIYPGDWIGISADNVTATFRSMLGTPGDSTLGSGRQYRQTTAHPLPAAPSSLIATIGYTIVMIGN